MDEQTQHTMDDAANYFTEKLNDIEKIKSNNKRLRSQYTTDCGYPGSLASFLALAQDELAMFVGQLKEPILETSDMHQNGQKLGDVLDVLKKFSKAIEIGAHYVLVWENDDLEELIYDTSKALLEKYPHWNGFQQEEDYNFELTHNPIFSVKPTKKAKEVDTKEEPQKHGQKLYTVFVGSTYTDLKETRAAVLRQLNSSEDYIPIGMEYFTASYEEQLEYIKDRLKDTDIYVLILGGRYGSLIPKNRPGEEDKSYTQKEFELAMADPDIRVLAFPCDHPKNLDAYKDNDTKSIKLLDNFYDMVLNKSGLTVKPWTADRDEHTGEIKISTPDKIAADVYQSLTEMDRNVLRGWIRG